MMHRLSDHAEPGLNFVLEVWRRRKWVALVVFVASAAGALTVTRSLPDLYRATASVLVEKQEVSEAFVRPSVTAELETRIQTIHQRVMSRANLTEVIASLNLYPHLRGRVPIDAIIERMRRDIQLNLKRVEQTTTGRLATIAFTLSYSGRDRRAVAQVANTLVAFYVEENTKSRERQAVRTAEFLEGQLAKVKRELDAQERRRNEFESGHPGELAQQVGANLAALGRLDTQLRLNSESQIRAMERRERLEKQLAEADSARPITPPPPPPEVTQLSKRKQELAELRRQFSDRYPDVIKLEAEIATLEQQVAHLGTNGHTTEAPPDPAIRLKQAFGAADSEIKSLKEEEGFLRQVIASYEARVENAPKRHQEFQQLSSEYERTMERYETLLKRYEEAQLAENLEQGENVEQFRILDPAIPPNAPVAPNRQLLLVMGLIVSAALAFGAVVATEKLDTTFHTVDDLRAFVSVPTLATIRLIPTTAGRRRRQRRLVLVTVLTVVGLILIVAGSHYIASGNEQIVRRVARVLE